MLTQAAAMGITTLSASGDLGFRGCFINQLGTMFPASSPFVTGVGGTDLRQTASNRIARQVVWSTYATQSDQGVGSGGGPSNLWRRPSFQGAPGLGQRLKRGTPLEAAIVALVTQQERKAGRPRLGSLPPLRYSLARGRTYRSVFFDITQGTSSPHPRSAVGRSPAGGAAQRGYDLATGLGSLKAAAFANAVTWYRPGRAAS